MNVGREKINCREGKIDILNVKLDERKVAKLLEKDGYCL